MGSATSIIRLSLESNQYEQGLRGAKRQFEDFTASIGINMKKMTAYGLAAGAAASAINGLTSAISEAFTEGNRMAKEMEGVRAAFKRLDQPNLLNNLREATHGTVNDLELMKQAVKFDNFNLSLEQMGTFLAFAKQQAKDTGQDVGYLVDSIVTGLGRKSLPILDNLGLSAEEIRNRMKETGDMTTAVAEIIQERMAAAGGYVETASDRATKATVDLENAMTSLGETFAPLVGASDSLWNSIKIGAINALNTAVRPLIQALAEAGALGPGARSTAGFNNLGGNSKVDRMIGRLGNGKSAGAYSIYKQQLAEFDRYINNKQFQIAAFGNDNSGIAQSAKTRLKTELDGALRMREEYIRRAQELHNKVVSPQVGGGSSSGSGGGGGGKTFDPASIAFNADKAALAAFKPEDVTGPSQAWEAYTSSMASAFEEPLSPLQQLNKELAEMKANLDNAPDTQSYQQGLSLIAEKEKEIAKIKGETKTEDIAKDTEDAWKGAASAMAQVGSAMASIEDPAAKTASLVMQAIATVAQAFSQALSKDKTTTGNIWAFIAASVASTASMIGMISSIHSATGYAQGGIVDGRSYSGDNIPILANAGEVVLTRAMTSNLASQLENNGLSNLNLTASVSAEQIRFVLNTNGRRTGRGEFVQTNSK